MTVSTAPPPLVAAAEHLVRLSWIDAEAVDALARVSKALRHAAQRLKWRRRTVRSQGFPSVARFGCWVRAGKVRKLQQEALAGKEHVSSTNYYLSLIGTNHIDECAVLASTGVEGEIGRDIQRTFPTLSFFEPNGSGVQQLGNVLKAIAMHDPDVGYCQGMNYVVAATLLIFSADGEDACPDLGGASLQEATFWIVLALVRHCGMAELWRKKMPGLSQCIYLYNQLLRTFFFDLSVHLRHIGMHPSFLATQWFVTIFARVLSTATVARVWDLFLLDGWKMVFRLALTITARVQQQLLSMDMEQCSLFFRKNPKLGLELCRPEELIEEALQYKVTRRMLRRMQDEMHIEVRMDDWLMCTWCAVADECHAFKYLRLRLQEAPLSHEHRMLFPSLDANSSDSSHGRVEALARIRAQLAQFDSDVASDSVVLQHKIEAADKALTRATAALHSAAYALSEGMFALAEQMEICQRLHSQEQELTALAVAAAMSPEPTPRQGATRRSKSVVKHLWRPPAAALEFLNSRMLSCFERVAGAADTAKEVGGASRADVDERERTLQYLELLVPTMAADVRATQRKLSATEREVDALSSRLGMLQRASQLAQVELEEAQDFKDCLADQLLQIMLRSQRRRNERMQSLFADADRVDGGGLR